MPKYIYLHPDSNEEIEITHAMSEVKHPSQELLNKITLPDGRIMKRKIVAPALVGFDNLGRSVLGGKQEKENVGSCGKSVDKCDCAQAPKPADTKSATAA